MDATRFRGDRQHGLEIEKWLGSNGRAADAQGDTIRIQDACGDWFLARRGNWIVIDGDQLCVMTDAEFRRRAVRHCDPRPAARGRE